MSHVEFISREEFESRHKDNNLNLESLRNQVDILRQSVENLSLAVARREGSLKALMIAVPVLTFLIGLLTRNYLP